MAKRLADWTAVDVVGCLVWIVCLAFLTCVAVAVLTFSGG